MPIGATTHICAEATYGLGPCIDIALAYDSKLFLLHVPSACVTSTAENFFAAVDDAIPSSARAALKPVLAGGKIAHGDGDTAAQDRQWVVTRLKELGFGPPRACGCPSNAEYQELELNRVPKLIYVSTSMSCGDKTCEFPF